MPKRLFIQKRCYTIFIKTYGIIYLFAISKPAKSEKDLTGCKSTIYTINYFNYNKF